MPGAISPDSCATGVRDPVGSFDSGITKTRPAEAQPRAGATLGHIRLLSDGRQRSISTMRFSNIEVRYLPQALDPPRVRSLRSRRPASASH